MYFKVLYIFNIILYEANKLRVCIIHYSNIDPGLICFCDNCRPKDTPFEDGTFKLTLQFSEEYPNKPPVVRFVSKMFHPNGEDLNIPPLFTAVHGPFIPCSVC